MVVGEVVPAVHINLSHQFIDDTLRYEPGWGDQESECKQKEKEN